MAKSSEARTTAIPLAVRIRIANLFRSDKFRMCIASPPRAYSVAANHRRGEKQQLGTDFEMRQIGGSEVDVEADFILLKMEADHPAVRKEIGGLTHRQNREAAQALEDCGLALRLITAEKKDVAALKLLRRAEQPDVERAGADELALDGALHFRQSRLVVIDAQDERWSLGVEGAARPVDKLRKME